jgi:hypothetical protein
MWEQLRLILVAGERIFVQAVAEQFSPSECFS